MFDPASKDFSWEFRSGGGGRLRRSERQRRRLETIVEFVALRCLPSPRRPTSLSLLRRLVSLRAGNARRVMSLSPPPTIAAHWVRPMLPSRLLASSLDLGAPLLAKMPLSVGSRDRQPTLQSRTHNDAARHKQSSIRVARLSLWGRHPISCLASFSTVVTRLTNFVVRPSYTPNGHRTQLGVVGLNNFVFYEAFCPDSVRSPLRLVAQRWG